MGFHEERVHVGLTCQIYWPASRKPFSTGSRQRESGVWGLGLLCIRSRGQFRLAIGIGNVIWFPGGRIVHIREMVQAGKFAPWQRRACTLVRNYHAGCPLTPAGCLHEDGKKFVTGLGTLTNLGVVGNIPPHRVRSLQCCVEVIVVI